MLSTVFSFVWSQWLIFVGVGLFGLYKWLTSTYDFFAKKNITYEKPFPLLGNFGRVLLQKDSMFETYKRFYTKHKGSKFIGIFEMRNPVLLVQDPDIIKQIAVKDFDFFLNHRPFLGPEIEPLLGNSLFSLKNQKWKDMRTTLSPAFTGSKLRLMFQLVNECGCNASKYLKLEVKDKPALELNLKDFFTHFTIDVIATCAFGLHVNSLFDKENQFYQMSRKATNFSGWAAVKFFLFVNFRKIMMVFKTRVFSEKFTKYFYDLVLDAMEQRLSKGIVRPDMINLLLEARRGTLQADDLGKASAEDGFAVVQESHIGQGKTTHNWTDDDIVAQCFVFFLAGFETASVLMCFCAHELMENPDVQGKLREEIDEAREELGDKPLTYETLQKMKYLDMVMSETLRKWPPSVIADRACTKPYVIGDKNGEHIQMNPGDILQMNIVGLHHDPDYFPNPEKFDPERFSDENKHSIKPFTYMPFGVGPRTCIGSRFALMEAKAIIFHLLSEFTLEASPKSCVPLKISTKGVELQPENGFWLNFKPRN